MDFEDSTFLMCNDLEIKPKTVYIEISEMS